VPSVSYSEVRERLRALHARGLKILVEKNILVKKAGDHAERIHDWVRNAEEVLHLVDDVLPGVLSAFRDLKEAVRVSG
jgi:hypothetical protein